MTERDLQSAVIELAQLLHWRVAHFRPALTAKGWRTPVEANGAGFPDLVMVRGDRLVFAELKSATGIVSAEQYRWMLDLTGAGCEKFLWRPADWTSGTIETELRKEARGLVED